MNTEANDGDQHHVISQMKEGGRTRAADAAAEEDPEHGGRTDLLREGVERKRRDDRAGLTARGGDTVRECAETSGEDLGGVAVRRRVRAEVEEELEEREAHDERDLGEGVEAAREDTD